MQQHVGRRAAPPTNMNRMRQTQQIQSNVNQNASSNVRGSSSNMYHTVPSNHPLAAEGLAN